MTNKEKAAGIQKYLMALYPDPPIPLYHTNPYTLCIAVLLSAHTTDKSVNGATPTLFGLADNPADMVKLSPERIQSIIRTVGLSNTKSRNVWNLSRILLEKHGGELPRTLEELEELPGVGHKTASVVMCQAFGVATFPVDTHIHRLAERWGLSNGKNVEKTEADLKALFPRSQWPKLHLQMIYYGREYCPARNHNLSRCQICSKYGTAAIWKESMVKVTAKKASNGKGSAIKARAGKAGSIRKKPAT
ncbi:MAG: endonuclease III [Fibrobacterota bacterium]|nr:endonuclease III [Fibrobacterota bacterium]